MGTLVRAEELRTIRILHMQGKSVIEICAATGRCRSTIKHYLKIIEDMEAQEKELTDG